MKVDPCPQGYGVAQGQSAAVGQPSNGFEETFFIISGTKVEIRGQKLQICVPELSRNPGSEALDLPHPGLSEIWNRYHIKPFGETMYGEGGEHTTWVCSNECSAARIRLTIHNRDCFGCVLAMFHHTCPGTLI
eukprot:174896-Prorocentrum_minimum.AAC.2